jgi:hypothetical protein
VYTASEACSSRERARGCPQVSQAPARALTFLVTHRNLRDIQGSVADQRYSAA